MAELPVALISGFTGAFSALILAIIKENISRRLKEKSALVQTKYLLIRYLRQVMAISEWYEKNKMDFTEIFQGDVPSDLSSHFSDQYIKSLSYMPYNAESLEIIVGLKLKIDDLSYLTEKNPGLLDAILNSGAQYNKIIKIIAQRNKIYDRLKDQFDISNTPERMIHALRRNESDIISITTELFKTLRVSEIDLNQAIFRVNTDLDSQPCC